MRDMLGDLHPSRTVAKRMHELEGELRHARTQLRRYSKSPDTLGRWGLEQPTEAKQEEGWFITYLDMMTLLLVVMIVMLAFSGNLNQAAAPEPAANKAMAATEVSFDALAVSEAYPIPLPVPPITSPAAQGSTAVTGGTSVVPPPVPQLPLSATPYPDGRLAALDSNWTVADLAASFVGPPRPDPAIAAATLILGSASPPDAMPDVAVTPPSSDTAERVPSEGVPSEGVPSEGESLAAGLALDGLGEDVEIVVNERSVSFRVNSEILFDSSQADLSREGLAVLRRIITVLSGSDHEITVEGHTDAVPVRRNVRFPSNWELSSARAGSVVRYLQANGIDKTRLKAVGYADGRPIADNHTPEGRGRNRRVELVIEKR